MEGSVSARILIVDDEISLSLLLQRYLSGLYPGGQIDTADTAQAALDRLACARYDLVIADYLLPDANGFQVLRRAQAQQPPAEGILITGCPSPALEQATHKLGAAWLAKPFDLRDLQQLVLDRLERASHLRPDGEVAFAAD